MKAEVGGSNFITTYLDAVRNGGGEGAEENRSEHSGGGDDNEVRKGHDRKYYKELKLLRATTITIAGRAPYPSHHRRRRQR
jgi:hypothetical protein